MLYTTIDGIQKEIEELSFDLNCGVKKRTSDLKYKKGDRNSRILITQFYDNDMPFNLQGYNVRMYAIKPDETKVFDDCEIIDHEYGTIKITLKEQMLNVAGTVQCEFVLTAADGSLMSTPVFKIIVQDSIHDTQAIESSNEFNALLNAIDTVDGLDNRMEVLKTETEQKIAKTNAQLSHIMYNAVDYGITGIGNETQVLQDFLNMVADNHGVAYLPSNITVNVRAINIDNKKDFRIKFDGIIKRCDNVSVSSMLNFSNLNNVIVENINFDGNSINNNCKEDVSYTVNEEQKHCMTMKNCHNLKLKNVEVYNPCGDGIYISDASSNIHIGRLYGHSDLRLGRNLLSLINCSDIYVDDFICKNIGHFSMPGGLDIEPNHPHQTVENIYITNCHIESEGTNPLSIMATNASTCNNVNIGNAYVRRMKNNDNSCVIISGSNVSISSLIIDTYSSSNGVSVLKHSTTPTGIKIGYLNVKNSRTALMLSDIEDFSIDITARNCHRDGVEIEKAKNGLLNLDIDSVGSDRFPLYKNPGLNQGVIENIIFSGNISKRGTGLKAFRTAGSKGQIINCKLVNLDFTGWNEGERIYGDSGASGLTKYNCKNLTSNTQLLKREDVWVTGDYISNENPSVNEKNEIVKGWICVEGGTYGTWKEDKITVS